MPVSVVRSAAADSCAYRLREFVPSIETAGVLLTTIESRLNENSRRTIQNAVAEG